MFRISSSILQCLCFLLTTAGVMQLASATEFFDDLGVKHEFPDDRPAKIVLSSYGARGLRHFGLTADELVATYHSRMLTGSGISNFDPTGYDGAEFPVNPSEEEMEFLSRIEDLSKTCNALVSCQTLDVELFRSLASSVDFVIMEGNRHQVALFGAYVQQIEEIMGKPIIFIDISLVGPDCRPDEADRCYGKSFIDIAKQMEELALFLKFTPPPTLKEDKELLCRVSQEFQTIAAGAHERGVRVMAAYIAYQDMLVPTFPADNKNYFANPPDDNVLRMLEELGMPLLHPHCNSPDENETCPFGGYYWETVLTDRYFGSCNSLDPLDPANCADDTFYPVDMWLYDHRSTQWVTNPAFADVFPDKALVTGQMAYWPIGGLNSVSYRFAAEILQEIAPVLDAADRIHPATNCTSADVSGEAHRTVGLPQGEYACYDIKYHNEEYSTCATDSPTSSPIVTTIPDSDNEDGDAVAVEGEDSGLGTGAIAGIVAAFVVLLFVVGFACYKKSGTNETEFDTMDPAIQKAKDAENIGEDESEGQSSGMGTDSAATNTV